MKKAAATWSGEWWKVGGGGTVWDAAIYDPVTDLLYFGIGNGTPWNAGARDPKGGDNLYTASIVAVKADTGEYVWHYQETPGDFWDFDAVSPLMLVDLNAGRPDASCSHAGFEERLLLHPGRCERQAAARQRLHRDELGGRRGHEDRPAPGPQGGALQCRPALQQPPGPQGAHAWHPMSYSPETGLVYIPVQTAYFPWVADPKYVPRKVGYNIGDRLQRTGLVLHQEP